MVPKLGFHFDHRKTSSISSSSSSSNSSFSSSSSSSFYFPDEPTPLSPATALKLSGVPFSWEKLPGIPKSCRRNSSDNGSAKGKTFLPLPPSSTTPRKQSKLSSSEVAQWDPFMAALVECSRDEKNSDPHHDREGRNGVVWSGAKVSRSISDRFRLYGSCKHFSSVSESIVYISGSSGRRPYGHRRSVDKLSLWYHIYHVVIYYI